MPSALPSLPEATAEAAIAALAARAARDVRDGALAQLLQRAATGDAAPFEAFYDATAGIARALARRFVRDADLDDVLADAYFQAWREAPRFDTARGSALAWLLTLVRSRALDQWRRHRHDGAMPSDDDGEDAGAQIPDEHPGPADLLEAAERGSRLHQALATLSAQERWVLGLAYFRELSHSAIAEATGLPLGTVKSLILRAQHRLRAQLA